MVTSNTSNTSNTPSVKYRPYFTSPEIDELIRCLKLSSSDIPLVRYLETFRAKISFDAVSKVVATPRATIEQRLGFTLDELPKPSQAEVKFKAYNCWLIDPEKLSMRELELAHLWRYENDLMTPEEEADFETQIGL